MTRTEQIEGCRKPGWSGSDNGYLFPGQDNLTILTNPTSLTNQPDFLKEMGSSLFTILCG